jgi:antirestriction protein
MSHDNNNENQQGPEAIGSPEIGAPDGPRLYVASLSDYNAGVLHGVWLRADVEAEDLWDGINEMLAASPTTQRYGDVAEEWAIHDYEGFSSFVRLGEYESIERVAALARGIGRYGDAFAAWWSMDTREENDDEGLDVAFQEQYLGEFSSIEDYGRQILDDMGIEIEQLPGVPEGLRPYVRVDVEAWTRDMQMGGEISTVESQGGIYVFWSP